MPDGKVGKFAQATHRREGEAGYNVSLEGTMGDTQKSQTISTENQGLRRRAFSVQGVVQAEKRWRNRRCW